MQGIRLFMQVHLPWIGEGNLLRLRSEDTFAMNGIRTTDVCCKFFELRLYLSKLQVAEIKSVGVYTKEINVKIKVRNHKEHNL